MPAVVDFLGLSFADVAFPMDHLRLVVGSSGKSLQSTHVELIVVAHSVHLNVLLHSVCDVYVCV